MRDVARHSASSDKSTQTWSICQTITECCTCSLALAHSASRDRIVWRLSVESSMRGTPISRLLATRIITSSLSAMRKLYRPVVSLTCMMKIKKVTKSNKMRNKREAKPELYPSKPFWRSIWSLQVKRNRTTRSSTWDMLGGWPNCQQVSRTRMMNWVNNLRMHSSR